MSRFERFIRLYDLKGVLLVGCVLSLVGITVATCGYLLGSGTFVLVGVVTFLVTLCITAVCAILAILRRAGRFTPANDMIMYPHLGDILPHEIEERDEETFWDDLVIHVPEFANPPKG